jgi:hypothetical protein
VVETPRESTETVEIPQVTLVQDRSFFEVKIVQGMGGLMYQHAQHIMKWMQDNLDLVKFPRLSSDIPEEIPTGPSNPNFINLDIINRSGNPESTMPPAGSPIGVMTQPNIGWVSLGTSMPNPLNEFINIYNDDEISKASRRTPVHVQEEKGPDKTSSPAPKVQTQEIP